MGVTVQEQGNGSARAPIAVKDQGGGLALRNIDDMWRFAQMAFNSGLCPKGFNNAEAVFIALQMGAEVGLGPMASIQNIGVVNGRPAVWGDAMLAVCMRSKLFDFAAFTEREEGAGNEMRAICTVRRLPDGEVISRTFSMKDAATAGLLGKDTPWKHYPRRMLQMRARSWACRDAFPDALKGISIAEELFGVIDVGQATVVENKPPKSKIDALTDRLAVPRDDVRPVETAKPDASEGELVDTETLEEIEQACAVLKFNGVRLESHLKATYGKSTTGELTPDMAVDFRSHLDWMLEQEPTE